MLYQIIGLIGGFILGVAGLLWNFYLGDNCKIWKAKLSVAMFLVGGFSFIGSMVWLGGIPAVIFIVLLALCINYATEKNKKKKEK